MGNKDNRPIDAMRTDSADQEVRLKGNALSEGVVVGRVCLFNETQRGELPVYKIGDAGVPREIKRFQTAVAVAADQLERIRVNVAEQIGTAEAGIFVAQRMILEDEALQQDIMDRIRLKRDNAEAAVVLVFDSYESKLLEMDNEYIRERASDIGEVRGRLLDAIGDGKPSMRLQCEQGDCYRGRNRIVVAEVLTPGGIVALDLEHTLGFVTERGGVNSHAAILARALGIPAVSGIEEARQRVSCGSHILVDGTTGEVVLNPVPATAQAVRFRTASVRCASQLTPVPPINGFSVMANINMPDEVGEALSMQAEGIGLYRTEFEVIAAGRMFTEDELYERYEHVVKAMAGATVTFRLLDLGSDKTLSFMQIPPEDNPALGWRGARLLLGNSDLLNTQARALARASCHGTVHILYPMIVDREQFLTLRGRVLKATADVVHGQIRHGVMLEVPSACLQADDILTVADFASIGTNDLTQYLFAVDRDNALVADDYSSDRPALWQMLQMIAAAGTRTGKSVSLCGELGGNPKYVAKLLDAGINCVSTSARRIPRIRKAAQAASP